MRATSSLVVVAVTLLSARSQANPIAMEVARARQVPGTTHVQVSHAIDASLKKENTPLSVRRDDTVLHPTWSPFSPFGTNTGSGVHETNAKQFCDCNVPLGAHRYAIRVKGLDSSGRETDLTADLTVLQPGTAPRDAGVVGDLSPWQIPDPAGIQGLDCVVACAKPAVDAGTKPTVEAGAKPIVDAGAKPPANDGGCSFPGRGETSGAALLTMMALAVALGIGRRRARRR